MSRARYFVQCRGSGADPLIITYVFWSAQMSISNAGSYSQNQISGQVSGASFLTKYPMLFFQCQVHLISNNIDRARFIGQYQCPEPRPLTRTNIQGQIFSP